MPVTGAIPLPESGADAFMSGASQSQNMINGMMNNKYNRGMLDVQQQAQARAQSLLPYLIQQYKDTHGKAASEQHMQDMYDTITQYEIKRARPDLFGGAPMGGNAPMGGGQSMGGGQPPMQDQPTNIDSSAPFNFSGMTGNSPKLPPENRQRLIAALSDPKIPLEEKHRIANFIKQSDAASRNPQQNQPESPQNQELSAENRKRLEDFVASGQGTPEDVQQIKQFLNSTQSAVPNDDIQPQDGGQVASPPQPMPTQDQQQPPAPAGSQPSNVYSNQQTNAAPFGQPGEDYSVSQERVISPGVKGMEWRDNVAGLGKFPAVETKPDFKNGLIYRKYPSGKETVQKMQLPQGMSIEDRAREKQTGTETGKLIGELEKSVVTSDKLGDTYEKIGEILVNPVWKDMRTNPAFLGKQLDYFFTKAGTPQQQRLAGAFMGYTGQVVADMAGQFKGQFRVGEQHLIDSMKVNKSDTMQTAKGKLDSLMNIREMMVQRATIETRLMRKGVTPIDAKKQADNQVNAALVQKIIREKLKIPQDEMEEQAQQQKDEEKKQAKESGASDTNQVSELGHIVMYKGQDRYEFPAKYLNSPKLKGYTYEPT